MNLHKAISSLLIGLCLNLPDLAPATDWNSQRAQILLSARSKKELDQKLNRLNQDKFHEENCPQELEHKRVPRSCYILLSREKKTRNPNDGSGFSTQFLDPICIEASTFIDDLDDYQFKSNFMKDLSRPCREAIEKRLKELQYAYQFDKSRKVFLLRHGS